MKIDIDAFNKKRAAAFNQHKNILKKLSKGQTLLCEQCNKPLQLDLNGQDKNKGLVSCTKGCTSIELELG
ncbi:hypothetical protein C1E24_00905 [Pseudoalteromonas phenolica]|uniref:Uncharacterized protein n=1 Tax=Pseudoalteromonas phenolica TaxID=161398 RepID=A0A5R9Q998_9GAMM|nr:hypothetical protein [Pseudoalteromonas phenolica]TLX49099.1 hypothetical protein C1E24_00905 [Pseudoalteromonas phenolica]